MDYFEDIDPDQPNKVSEPEAEYLNDPSYKYWRGVQDKLSEWNEELSQKVKDLLDERMAAVENGAAVFYDLEDLKIKYEKMVKK